ncbi:glycerol kinase GlpK [Sphingomonas sp.]|uniref:glycerol kinase GlpK n=1 Tax=Sphingomonas sp. TaxID=28214 RepID=UPI003D6CC81C
MSARYVLAIDQGTTSSRAILFGEDARAVAVDQREFAQHYPQAGWVEHDAEEIWRDTLAVTRGAIARSKVDVADIAAIGITNQRETIVVWDRATGAPIHRAIVWQDRRTADVCDQLRSEGVEPMVQAKTGLLLDPYFSGTKLAWILDNVAGARDRAERGELAAGTIDSFVLWRLTAGGVHATDPTNAGRTMLFDIHRGDWDDELLRLLRVPRQLLPEVRDNSGVFGTTTAGLFGRPLPIAGMAGDQQAALFGQACFAPGMVKSTYGTGCFMLMNTGEAVASTNRLLTTPAYRLNGKTTYALEGSIFVAGAAVKWLRDKLGVIAHASETLSMATQVDDNGGVYLVPGFVGLGAPHWRPEVRGLLTGMTLDTSAAHLARAALEAVAYQTRDLVTAMVADGAARPAALRVDGGMAANDWLCHFLADMAECPVERPAEVETTALGAAFLAGLATGVWSDLDALAETWTLGRRFTPTMAEDHRATLVAGWEDALRRAIG